MNFVQPTSGHFEVTYGVAGEMQPGAQAALVRELEQAVKTTPVSVLFRVEVRTVAREVPEFWLGESKRLAPQLCAFAVVADSIAVRAATRAFAITNGFSGVRLEVRPFTPAELETVRRWCETVRVMRGAAAPSR